MRAINKIFDRRGVPLLAVAFGLLWVAQRRRPLRRQTAHQVQRAITNFVVSVPAFALLRLLLLPTMVYLARHSQRRRLGLLHALPVAHPVKAVLALLMLDYTNYLWHVLNHKIPALWSFHLVHHTDADLDLTTAVRFHFGEMIGSVVFRGGVVWLLGITQRQLLVYEVLFEAATQFHHTNLRLPWAWEKVLSKAIVTPRMHGIHHSVIKQETDSNYSVIFNCWDVLHHTLRLNIPQNAVVIGVPGYHHHRSWPVGQLLQLPFKRLQPWDAQLLVRNASTPTPPGQLAP